jgi:hypothetical protein
VKTLIYLTGKSPSLVFSFFPLPSVKIFGYSRNTKASKEI